MNIFFDFDRRAGWLPNAVLLCLLLVLVASSGCTKSDRTPASVAPSQESNSTPTAAAPTAVPTATPPSGPAQPPVPSSATNSGLTQLQLLNRAMVGWMMKNHRHPRTFEEFASTANFQIPDPPAGQKYALNQRGFIVLVNSTQ